MKKISTFNKFFIILCAVVIVLLAFTVPHEPDGQETQQTTAQMEDE